MSGTMNTSPLWGVWNITKRLGSGTFGDVYEAKRTEAGREYKAAIKHIPIPPKNTSVQALVAEGTVTDEASARQYCQGLLNALIKEIDICYELKGYTNFVSYEDHMIIPRQGEVGFDVYIRMELLTSLPDYISQNGITVGGITKLCEDMCTALGVLEQKRIIHRDIKPANIFVNSSGEFKLGDFGVARHMEGLGSMSVKGTYNYMAAEILKGGVVGANSDLYSLGLVLYRLLNNNRAPFLPPPPVSISYEEEQRALDRRLQGEPLPPPDRAELSLPLTNVVMRAVEYAPARRYQSALEMKQALADFRRSQSAPTQGLDLDATVALDRSPPREPLYAMGAAPSWNQGSGAGSGGSDTGFGSSGGSGQAKPAQSSNKTMFAILFSAVGVIAVLLVIILVIVLPKNNSGDNADIPSQAPESEELVSELGTPEVSPTTLTPTPTFTPTPTPTPTPSPTPELLSWAEIEVVASASSTRASEYNYTYNPENVLNYNTSSPWVEGASGYGIGEWIQISTADGKEAVLSEISIQNGHHRSGTELFYKNGRVQDIKVEFSDGSSITAALKDEMGWQTLVLPQSVNTSYVRIVIESIYTASRYEDTCIARIACS